MKGSERAARKAIALVLGGDDMVERSELVTVADIIEREMRVTEEGQATPHLAINRELSDLREKWNAAERRVTELEQALATILKWEQEYRVLNNLGPHAPHPFKVAEALLERQKESKR